MGLSLVTGTPITSVGADGSAQHARWYREARAFARLASERGGALTSNGVAVLTVQRFLDSLEDEAAHRG